MYLIISFFFIVFSINNLDYWGGIKYKKIKFPIEKKISAIIKTVPPVIYSERPGLVISGEYIILVEPRAKKIFSVFKLPDCNYIGGYGNVGAGPLEHQFVDARTVTATNDGIQFFDIYKGLTTLRLIDSGNVSLDITKRIRLPGELFPLNDAFQLNDSIICGLPNTDIKEEPYVRYNLHTMTIDYFGEYPNLFKEDRKKLNWQIYIRRTVVKPDRSKFASFCNQVKMFRIYSYSGILEKEEIMEVQKDFFDGAWIRLNPKKYYGDIKSTEKYIYVLCDNNYSKELMDNIPVLEVWDWNGYPIACFTLDRPIIAFDITKDNEQMYCIDRVSMENFFVYDIKVE